MDLSIVGKVGLVQEDGSPLQLGTEFRYQGKTYEIVGRIQARYAAGFWNEWYAMAGEEGVWLGESQGLYFVSQAAQAKVDFPSFDALAMGSLIYFGNQPYAVSAKYEVVVTGCQGSLPFVHQQGYRAQVADLKSATEAGATLDYSEQPPLVFLGSYLKFDALTFRNLRTIEGW
jgi:Domain of unknown function (DUF4178)